MSIKEVLAARPTQLIIVFVVGLAAGAIFYPSSKIEKKISERYEQQISKLNQQHSAEMTSMKSKLTNLEQKNSSMEAQYKGKLSSLTDKVSQLQKSKKVNHYKLIKPDGTIEERTVIEDVVSESTQITKQIQQEYEAKLAEQTQLLKQQSEEKMLSAQREFQQKEQEYQSQIKSLSVSEKKEVNMKKFGAEIGLMTSRDYYLHFNADIVGPVFLGGHAQMGFNSAVGAGIGLRF